MNTAESTSAIPTTGPVNSSIAFRAASLGESPSSICLPTPSTTTMASSTTNPIASTNPNRESVLIEKPNKGKKMNVPINATGTANIGISVARHILHSDYPAIGRFANHDLSEVIYGNQSPLRPNRVGVLLPFGHWLAPHLSCGVHSVLRLNSADDFGNSNAQLAQLIRLHPQSHRILPGAEDLHISDARGTRQRIVDIDIRVVGEERRVVRPLRRVQGDQHQR